MDYYEAQVFTLKNTPGIAPADAEFSDRWLLNVRIGEEKRVKTMVKEQRVANKAKMRDLEQRLSDLQDDHVRVRKQAERSEISWQELNQRTRLLKQARQQMERVHESLEASEQRSSVMEEAPLVYLDDWYNRFPALRDRRPSLAAALAEDREKRGLRY